MTYIILLRGVMPVGKNKVPMADLRKVLSDAGFGNVRTYIASGNALVDTDITAKPLAEKVYDLIKKHIGADLTVVIRTGAELQRILDINPFVKNYNISRVFFTMFETQPQEDKVKDILTKDYGEDQIAIIENTAYTYVPGSYARSTLSNTSLEKKLGVRMTTRNFNTMSKLLEMSKE